MKYFIYCRKSSDREDRQVLSTPAQKRLLQQFAKDHDLSVVDIYEEKRTAYKVGRPLFNEMLQRMEHGDADAILVYHLTRIARNSYDGGRVIYMMDEKVTCEIKTPESTYTNNSDDKFIMQIHFAMAKKSSDDTSQFVTRDIESKLLNGEYPGMVPPGYLNINKDGHITKAQDDQKKYITLLELNRPLSREEIDPMDSMLIVKLFEEAANGTKSIPALKKFSYQIGIRSRRSGKMLSKKAIFNILTNPYFYGVIEYNDKIYYDNRFRDTDFDGTAVHVDEIKHEALISKALFDRVQVALCQRKRISGYRKHMFAFGGELIHCGECSCAVTAERQKGHIYYHCTGNCGPCSQNKWVRESALEDQFQQILSKLTVPQSFLDWAFKQVRKLHQNESRFNDAKRKKLQSQYNSCKQKLDGLLKLKISPKNMTGELLSDDEYLAQKREIQQELDLLDEQLTDKHQEGKNWITDCERFFNFTQQLQTRFNTASVEDKKTLLLLVASNLALKNGEVAVTYSEPYATLSKFSLAGQAASSKFEPIKSAQKSRISVPGVKESVRFRVPENVTS